MKNIRKRIIAIAVLACMALSSFAGCSNNSVGKGTSATKTQVSDDSSSSSEIAATTGAAVEDITLNDIKNEDGITVATPFTVGSAGSNPFNLTDPEAGNLNNDTSGAAATTKIESVVVTDTAGAEVTDAAGAKVTETVVVTSPATTAASDGNYKSEYDSRYALWLDISQDKDFIFNGQFVKITFKIKEGIPDQDYAVRFKADFSNRLGQTTNPTVASQGTIRVGSGDIEANYVDTPSNEFGIYGDNIACKQGDTIDYYINLQNNPGLVATLLWMYFDKNAMDVVSIEAVGEFAEQTEASIE